MTGLVISNSIYAATPVWTYSAPNPAIVNVSDGETATVEYTVTNQSTRAKNLVLKSTPGVSASACYLAAKGSVCTLTLTIAGSQIPHKGIHGGPVLCEKNNSHQCYQPGAANVLNVNKNNAGLVINTDELVLSVTQLTEYNIPVGSSTASGRARTLTITNTSVNAATEVNYTVSPALPSGTTITPASCGTIAPQGTCVLTITPGDTPSAPVGLLTPSPITLSVAGSNTNTVNSAIQVLAYGSVYQQGYVFSFDDTQGCSSATNCTGSVGGKVVTTTNQASSITLWSTDPTGTMEALDAIYGISQTSTPSSPNPDVNPGSPPTILVPGQKPCEGAADGACNTNNIFIYYQNVAGGPINLNFYATGLCKKTIDTYSDWYLPAICEMGYEVPNYVSTCGTASAPKLQNMQLTLSSLFTQPSFAGAFWSSTQYNDIANPADNDTYVWYQEFSIPTQQYTFKGNPTHLGVLCARGF